MNRKSISWVLGGSLGATIVAAIVAAGTVYSMGGQSPGAHSMHSQRDATVPAAEVPLPPVCDHGDMTVDHSEDLPSSCAASTDRPSSACCANKTPLQNPSQDGHKSHLKKNDPSEFGEIPAIGDNSVAADGNNKPDMGSHHSHAN